MHIIILVTCRTQVGPGVPICKIQIGLWCTCRSISTKLENPYWVFELSELLQASSVYSPSTTYIFDLRVTLYAHQWRCSPRCSSFPYLSGLQACFTLEIYGTCTGPRRQTKSTLIIVIAACKWYPQMKIITNETCASSSLIKTVITIVTSWATEAHPQGWAPSQGAHERTYCFVGRGNAKRTSDYDIDGVHCSIMWRSKKWHCSADSKCWCFYDSWWSKGTPLHILSFSLFA